MANIFTAEKFIQRMLHEKQKNIKNGIYHLTQIKFAYNSNHIEGNSLSSEQTKQIFDKSSLTSQDNQSIKISDILETINHFEAFDYMLEHIHDRLNADLLTPLGRNPTSLQLVG